MVIQSLMENICGSGEIIVRCSLVLIEPSLPKIGRLSLGTARQIFPQVCIELSFRTQAYPGACRPAIGAIFDGRVK